MDNYQKTFAQRALRKASLRWKYRNHAKNKDRFKTEVIITTTFKKGKNKGKTVTYPKEVWHADCNICKKIFKQSELEMDHVNPVDDPLIGWQNFDIFIDRLFVYEAGWQRLCPECHLTKSNSEGSIRTVVKQTKKKSK